MSKKIPLGIAIILLIVAIVATAVITVFVYLSHYDELLSDLPLRAQQYNKLSEVDELVRQEYYGDIDYNSVDRSLLQGYLTGLDENCFYVPAEDYEAFSKMLKGNLPGIGIDAYFDSGSDNLRITQVNPGTPAKSNGLDAGGYILSVDGKDISEDNYAELLKLLTESYDKKLRIVYSSDSTTSEEKQITSGYLKESVEYSIDNDIGYVRITAFYDNTSELFSEAINYFNNNSISKIIIDMRNTGGTNFDVAADIIDIIVPVGSEGTGAIYTAKDSSGSTVKQRASDATALNFSFAVLVNSRSQGAAELIACDLRDYSKAVVFGEKTYGNGTYQELFRLQDGGAVLLTVAEVYPYISDSFNGVGVFPDVEIITTETFKNQIGFSDLKEDEQYLSAYSYLTAQK